MLGLEPGSSVIFTTLNHLSSTLHLRFLWQILSPKLKLPDLPRLSGQQTQGVLLSCPAPALGLEVSVGAGPAFHVSAGYPNLGSHACVTSTSPTESSSQTVWNTSCQALATHNSTSDSYSGPLPMQDLLKLEDILKLQTFTTAL